MFFLVIVTVVGKTLAELVLVWVTVTVEALGHEGYRCD